MCPSHRAYVWRSEGKLDTESGSLAVERAVVGPSFLFLVARAKKIIGPFDATTGEQYLCTVHGAGNEHTAESSVIAIPRKELVVILGRAFPASDFTPSYLVRILIKERAKNSEGAMDETDPIALSFSIAPPLFPILLFGIFKERAT